MVGADGRLAMMGEEARAAFYADGRLAIHPADRKATERCRCCGLLRPKQPLSTPFTDRGASERRLRADGHGRGTPLQTDMLQDRETP